MGAPKVKFFDWKYSPFCMKVRAILDYKSVRYERINPLGSTLLSIYRRGKSVKVPAIEIEGELIVDSTTAHQLDSRRRFPSHRPFQLELTTAPYATRSRTGRTSPYFIGLYYPGSSAEGRRAIPAAFGNPCWDRSLPGVSLAYSSPIEGARHHLGSHRAISSGTCAPASSMPSITYSNPTFIC